MRRPRCTALAALVAAGASAAVAGCSDTDSRTAAPSTTRTTVLASSTPFPTPPPYTHEVVGSEIRVATASADPTDLLNTYNTVARTLRPMLPEGGYWVRINCTTGGTATADHRLSNGTIGVGKLGIAQTGGFGRFEGVVPGAHCP